MDDLLSAVVSEVGLDDFFTTTPEKGKGNNIALQCNGEKNTAITSRSTVSNTTVSSTTVSSTTVSTSAPIACTAVPSTSASVHKPTTVVLSGANKGGGPLRAVRILTRSDQPGGAPRLRLVVPANRIVSSLRSGPLNIRSPSSTVPMTVAQSPRYNTPTHTPTFHSPSSMNRPRFTFSTGSPRLLHSQGHPRIGAGRPPLKNESPIIIASPSSAYQRTPYQRLHSPTIRTRGGYGVRSDVRGGYGVRSDVRGGGSVRSDVHGGVRGGGGGVRMLTPVGSRPFGNGSRRVVSTVVNGGVGTAFSPSARTAAINAVHSHEAAMEKVRVNKRQSPSPATSASGNVNNPFSKPVTSADMAKASKASKEEDDVINKAMDNSDMDLDQENMALLDTYAEYVPAKLRSGVAHPDKVVETSSLSSVLPPDITYNVSIPEEIIDSGQLSALQLESIIYASQQHQLTMPDGCRAGFLIGDGAGVGKGRTLAGLIFENYILGRKKAIWCSVSNDLKYDSERDLKDIGANKISVYSLSKMKYSKISSKENGCCKKGVLFCTYSSLIGECRTAKSKYRTRLKQIMNWCGPEFDGLIVFDECHRAKNLSNVAGKSSKTGLAVLELQQALPSARVVYASATGASEPRNMAYMTRLGLWGMAKSFLTFQDFLNAVERKGVGAMEVVAMDLKQRGAYIARQLSFAGTSFKILQVPLDPKFVLIYDEAVKLWLEAHKHFLTATKLMEVSTAEKKKIWTQFWGAHQRFFKYLCISSKLPTCIRLTRESVKNRKSVVIGLQSTGEARTKELVDECGPELTDFVSTAKAIFYSMVDNFFPVPDGAYTAFDSSIYGLDSILFGGTSQTRKTRKLEDDDEGPVAKQARVEDTESSDTDSDSQSEEGEKDDDTTDWLKTLEEQAQSSDSEKEGDAASSSNESDQVDFNPFAEAHDDDDDDGLDPWAVKQKQLLDSPVKEKLITPSKPKEKRKKKKKADKRNYKAGYSAKEFLSVAKTNDEGISHGGSMAEEMNANRAGIIKAELLAAIERLGDRLPRNTLDELIDELGGPDYVAEMTGRKGRMVAREDMGVYYELRHESDGVNVDMLNMREKELFMNGDKRVAIISEAASVGISLQSDKRVKNQDRRVHLTLELPWSADRAIQQFGRTHRSNQVNGPEYIFMISELAGERRFASTVAKRLESLGALTHGDRRATESRDLSQFNLETKWGRIALDQTLKAITAFHHKPIVQAPTNYTAGDFFADMRLYLQGVGLVAKTPTGWEVEKDAVHISKFLNRILGLPVHAQNALFEYFSATLLAIINQAKKDNRYDMGILDVGACGDHVKLLETRIFRGRAFEGSYRTELVKVGVERGLAWEEALDIANAHTEDTDGFYKTSANTFAPRPTVVLVCHVGKKRADTGERLVQLYRPNTGLHARLETLSELLPRLNRIEKEDAQFLWAKQYEASATQCLHVYQHGRCRSETAGFECGIGKRTRCYHVLTGSVLSVWNQLDMVMKTSKSNNSRLQVVRFQTEQGHKVIGILIPTHSLTQLTNTLQSHCAGQSHTIKH